MKLLLAIFVAQSIERPTRLIGRKRISDRIAPNPPGRTSVTRRQPLLLGDTVSAAGRAEWRARQVRRTSNPHDRRRKISLINNFKCLSHAYVKPAPGEYNDVDKFSPHWLASDLNQLQIVVQCNIQV